MALVEEKLGSGPCLFVAVEEETKKLVGVAACAVRGLCEALKMVNFCRAPVPLIGTRKLRFEGPAPLSFATLWLLTWAASPEVLGREGGPLARDNVGNCPASRETGEENCDTDVSYDGNMLDVESGDAKSVNAREAALYVMLPLPPLLKGDVPIEEEERVNDKLLPLLPDSC